MMVSFFDDTTDTTGTSADADDAEVARILAEYGFTPVAGGQWLAPNGQLMTETAALKVVYMPKVGSDYYGQSATGAAYTRPQSAGGAPQYAGTAGGSGAAAPAADPLAVLRQQELQARIAESTADLAIKQQNLTFLRDKFAFETEQGMRTEARATQQQMFSQQLQVAQLQNNIAQFNSAQNVDVQQANFDNSERYATRQSNLATQIGQLAQNPIDYARATATSLANSGWGEEGSMAGVDNTSARSLMPLEQLLRIRSNSMGGPAPIIPQPVGVGLPTPGTGLPAGAPQPLPQTNNPLPLANPYAQINAIAAQQNATGTNTAAFNVGANATPGGVPLDTGGVDYSDAAMAARIAASRAAGSGAGGDLPRAEHGGVEDGAYISGEAGPEINIPLKDGRTVVLNKEQAKSVGINLDRVMKMAAGGIFDPMGMDDGKRGLATDFLRENVQQGLEGSGLGSVPAPVFASTPGFNPESAQYLAGLSQAGGGISANRYLQLAQLLRPAGVNEHAVRRTA